MEKARAISIMSSAWPQSCLHPRSLARLQARRQAQPRVPQEGEECFPATRLSLARESNLTLPRQAGMLPQRQNRSLQPAPGTLRRQEPGRQTARPGPGCAQPLGLQQRRTTFSRPDVFPGSALHCPVTMPMARSFLRTAVQVPERPSRTCRATSPATGCTDAVSSQTSPC